MQRSVAQLGQDKVLIEYTSAQGPNVTHLRGTLLAATQQNLKELKVYELYLDSLTARSREKLSSVIASSWIDIESATEHYSLIETLAAETGVTDADVQKIVEQVVARVTDTFIASMVRASRTAGVEAFSFVMSRNDKLWDRFYMGGGCTVTLHGPKELTLENHGNPLFSSRFFRMGYDTYTKVLTNLFCKSAVIKNVRPLNPRAHTLATRFSWV